MITAEATKFPRIENSQLGPGATIEYRSPAGRETLAYVDYNEAGDRAAVTVFTPSSGGERRYTERPAGRAMQIVTNHLRKQGYTLPDFDKIEDATPAAQLQHAGATARAAEETAQQELPVPVAAGTMGPFPEPPAPAQIPAGLPGCATREDAAAAYTAADPAPEFRSVEEAADAILGEPADVVRHWISRGGTIYQLHLRAIVPAAETADALRAFVESDAHGYTRSADGKIWLWSSHAWNCGYAVVLPAL